MINHYIQTDKFDLFVENITISEINSFHPAGCKSYLDIAIEENKPKFVSFMMKKVIDLEKQKLSYAVGDVKDMLTKRTAFLDTEYKAGYSRLHVAVVDGETEVIRYILNNRLFDKNNCDVPIGTALHLAVLLGRLDCINALMEYDIDVDIMNKHKQTALQMAIEQGIAAQLPRLFALSRNIDGSRYMGLTTLQMAIVYGCRGLLPTILDVGANVYVDIQMADDNAMQDTIASHRKVNSKLPLSSVENSLSLCLKLYGEIDPVLLNQVCTDEINTTDGHCNTLLHMAASLQNYEVCESLIHHGINVNFLNDHAKNALQEMFRMMPLLKHSIKKPVQVGTVLINAGINVNIDDWNDNNILKDSLTINSEKFFILVLTNTTVIDFSTIDFYSIVKRRWFAAANQLARYMPDNMKHKLITCDIVEFYMKFAKKEDIECLIGTCPDKLINKFVPEILTNLAKINDVNSFRCFMDVNITQPQLLSNGESILTHLIKEGKDEFVKLLLESCHRDVHINMKNLAGHTALHVSIMTKNIPMIDVFVLEYDHFNVLDDNGDTIFSLLFKKFGTIGDLAFVEKTAKVMITGGANPHLKDSKGIPSIDYCYDTNVRTRIHLFAQKKNIGNNHVVKNELECKICCNKAVECVLECGHLYCSDCVKQCKKCPVCRKPSKSIRKIFF